MRHLTIVITALLALVAGADAQREGARGWSLAPALLSQGGDYTGAARFGFVGGSRRQDLAGALPMSRYWAAEIRGTLALDPDLNPDPIAVQAAGGLAVSLAKPRTIAFDPANVDAPGRAMEYDYGDLALAAEVHVVTNQRRTEARAALGGQLVYTHDRQDGVWPFVPALHAAVGVARPLASELRDTLGVPDDETYLRLAAGLAWHVSADRGWMPGPLRPVWLHALLDVYRETSVDDAVSTTRLDDGTRVALTAAYRLLGTERRLVDEVFLRWTSGETPTLPAPRKAWMLGIALAP